MVRTFADRVIAGATASVPTDSVRAHAFSTAVRPTFRNRRGESRSARFSVCSLDLIQRVGRRGAKIMPLRSSEIEIVCSCHGIEVVAKEKSAMQVRSKILKRYRLRVHRAQDIVRPRLTEHCIAQVLNCMNLTLILRWFHWRQFYLTGQSHQSAISIELFVESERSYLEALQISVYTGLKLRGIVAFNHDVHGIVCQSYCRWGRRPHRLVSSFIVLQLLHDWPSPG
jgi:hypothetical protein